MNKKLVHLVLFVLTCITTTFAGAEWMFGRFLFAPEPYDMSFQDFMRGLNFSIPFILVLTVHEFGHYLTAKYYHIKATLPYYLPVWFGFLGMPSIGTMGAFIKIQESPRTTRQFFDVGVAGPLAGFVIALGVLFYGFNNLPPADYIYELHPDYQIWGENYGDIVYDLDTTIYKKDLGYLDQEILNQLPDSVIYDSEMTLYLGSNILFDFFAEHVASEPERVPNMYELYHYPWLFAGYLALFFTALNLLPVGQLDGGHVVYGLFGFRRSRTVFRVFFILFVLYAGFGLITPHMSTSSMLIFIPLYLLYLNLVFTSTFPSFKKRLLLIIWVFLIQYVLSAFIHNPYSGEVYLLFALIVGRFLGVDHPPSAVEMDLGLKRKIIGWIAIIVFLISFTPSPFNTGSQNKSSDQKKENDFPGQMVYIKTD